MGYLRTHTVSLSSTAGGTAVHYTNDLINGHVRAVRYVRPSASALSTGADMAIVGDVTGVAVLTDASLPVSATWYPTTLAAKSTDGSADTARVPPALGDERAKITITNSTAAGTATLYLIVGD